MANSHRTTRKLKIDKAQATMVGIIGGAVFVAVFSLVSSKALWTQRNYQARVIGKKEAAVAQLKTNYDNINILANTYKDFISTPENVIGGNPSGKGEKDGDNARIVLDALPSKYDYPAVVSSVEKLLTEKNFKIEALSGLDDEANQSKNQISGTPVPVEIPFNFSVSSNYKTIQELIDMFENSIRPISIVKLSLQGNESDMKFTVDAKTYYQAEKILNIKTEVMK